MDETFALVVMLGTSMAKGTWVPMADYNTEQQCAEAREAAIADWHDRHGPGYRVKFGAECVLTITPPD
jgi:hypothetical protein